MTISVTIYSFRRLCHFIVGFHRSRSFITPFFIRDCFSNFFETFETAENFELLLRRVKTDNRRRSKNLLSFLIVLSSVKNLNILYDHSICFFSNRKAIRNSIFSLFSIFFRLSTKTVDW